MNNLKEIRESYLLTQAELAKKAEMNAATIVHIETNRKKPHIATRRKIEKALGCEIDWDLPNIHPFIQCQYHGCERKAIWIVGEVITGIDVFTLLVCSEHRPPCLGGKKDSKGLWSRCNDAPYAHFGRKINDSEGNSYIMHWNS